jgi:hypothetical protein
MDGRLAQFRGSSLGVHSVSQATGVNNAVGILGSQRQPTSTELCIWADRVKVSFGVVLIDGLRLNKHH